MSSSTKANFARKMNAGAYHTEIFKRDEQGQRREVIVVNDGRIQSLSTSKPSLTTSFGDILTAALKK